MTQTSKVKKVETEKTTVFLLENILTKQELNLFNITFTHMKQLLLPPEVTGSATDKNGKPLKSNKSIFLCNCEPKPAIVEIFRCKVFSLLDTLYNSNAVQRLDSIYYVSRFAGSSGHLLSYYNEDGNCYPQHIDDSMITFLSWFDEGERNYKGGELYLPEIDLTVESKHNTGILIPGTLKHEVKPITITDSNKNDGRITYSVFTGTGGKQKNEHDFKIS